MSVNFFGSNCTPAEKKKAGPVNNIGTGVEEMRTVVSSQPLALGPCFCVRSFGLDVYLESGRDVGVELDRDFMGLSSWIWWRSTVSLLFAAVMAFAKSMVVIEPNAFPPWPVESFKFSLSFLSFVAVLSASDRSVDSRFARVAFRFSSCLRLPFVASKARPVGIK